MTWDQNGRGIWTVERALLVLTLSVSVLGVSFSWGGNWAQVTALESRLNRAERDHEQFQRGTEAAIQFRNLEQRLERIEAAIRELDPSGAARD